MLISTTQYFPKLELWAHAYQEKVWLLEAHENYQKRSARNRTQLANSQGIQRLSIPLDKGKNQQMPIRNVTICNDENWKKKHWESIKSAYGKAPFYIFYEEYVKDLIFCNHENLWEYNLNIIKVINKIMQLGIEIRETSHFRDEYAMEIDLRYKQKNDKLIFKQEKYVQLFEDRQGFIPNLSILDLLFCLGPGASSVLKHSIIENN